jgi:membrane fusion protein, heavy metal efflux system
MASAARTPIPGTVALAVGASLLATACQHAPAQANVQDLQPPAGEVWLTPQQVRDAKMEVAPVQRHQIDDTILTSGTITLEDVRTGHVFSPVTGRVVTIIAGLGQRVKKGDPLAVIESPDIGSAVSDVHKAEADLIAAEHDVNRKKALFEQKAGSAADLEASNDNYRRAKAEVERARQKEQLLRLGNADAVTQRYTLTSPVDGEILLRNINPGVEVQGQYSGGATVELFTIGELDRVWVLGDLYEMDMARVHVGAPANVTVVAYPGKAFTGSVDWVSGSLDPNTRTAKVRCTFDNSEKLLRPMMYSTVQISVEQQTALAIPRTALLRLGNDKVVYAQVGEGNGRLRFHPVMIDDVDETGSSPWLPAGKSLQENQKIVVNSAILLSSQN